MLLILLFCCTITFVTGRSPHADYFEDLDKSQAFSSRISDNIIEDATLELFSEKIGRYPVPDMEVSGGVVHKTGEVPDLVRKYNYPFEEHSVTTEDGYILGLHRILHGRDSHNKPGKKPVVFLMHGLLSSSADFIVMGPGSSLAYILAEEGYDVWMGNARGNYFSRRHRRLNPDAVLSNAFWEFSWDDIGSKDLPAMIDFVLRHTRQSALHYIGFSQGTTAFFAMGSLRPEYNRKIISMQAMAPVAYMGYINNPLLRALAPFANRIEEMAARRSIAELFPKWPIITDIGKRFCIDGAETQRLCTEFMFFMGGRNEDQHNATMLPVILGHYPAGAALRQVVHYGQLIVGGDFRRYDHGPIKNRRIYGTVIPPRMDLSRISAPVYLHYSESDPLADVRDVQKLFSRLGNVAGRIRVRQRTFSHVDFVWGIDAKTLVYDGIISAMRRRDRHN